jgi:3-phenylpropionate/trans-cinnamate dioxygenase ferredoxin subunit
MEAFVKVAHVRNIELGGCELVQVQGSGIAIFNVGGAFYAIEDCCTGDGGSLSEGRLMGSMIECPSDGARFYLPTGVCIHPRLLNRLHTFRIWIDRDDIKIDLREAAKIARWARKPLAADQLWGA